MTTMGGVVVAKFRNMLQSLTEDDFSLVVDHLVLVLGLLINFADGSPPARESFESLQGTADDPLDGMVQLFVDNVARMSEVSSVRPRVSALTNYLRPNHWKKAKRTWPSATLRFFLATFRYHQHLRHGSPLSSHEGRCDPLLHLLRSLLGIIRQPIVSFRPTMMATVPTLV